MGRALMGLPGPLWAQPYWASLDPYGPPLGPYGPGPHGPPWTLVGRALMGLPGPLWAGPHWDSLGPYWLLVFALLEG